MKATARITYKGTLIRKTVFGRYETPGLTWGDQPGEWHSFKTLTAAKAFIDRQSVPTYYSNTLGRYVTVPQD